MGNTFGNAYVTIAATSARDATQGFLERQSLQDPESQYVKVDSSSHGALFISTIIDDYPSDVENGVLNQRAWVLQERALSRRTIHFTANQTYWECGGGVRCETLTRMRNSKALFLSDPKFPASLMHRRIDDKIRLFQGLFEKYSQLGITDPTDRPIAISGLVDRLAETFKMRASHGVFEGYLHRSLLWHRADTARMQRIQFAEDRQIPSWSWMASSGRIEYRKVECCDVEWNSEIRFTDEGLQAPTRRLQQCKIEPRDDGACDIRSAANGADMGW
ncbi:hypothetical protein GT037_010603 [Alternaria burnsii]|uniref:Heterokaryon incompatibility domain-containing protein n=1 Tax=Alternaria burnsii TaxID=1187904 RepID=A0A8H7AU01_9PLEO|nr:uncharacterized protein GT037_010603 [Alternaria burnsii]KAF7671278.1 hypothetical protein GT037_010603 [Alternaria burnsii]